MPRRPDMPALGRGDLERDRRGLRAGGHLFHPRLLDHHHAARDGLRPELRRGQHQLCADLQTAARAGQPMRLQELLKRLLVEYGETARLLRGEQARLKGSSGR